MAAPPVEQNEANPEEKAPAPPSGGLGGWLPLIITVVLMPVVAYAMTTYVLLPKLQHSLGGQTVQARETSNNDGAAGGAEKAPAKESGKPKVKVPLSKVIVNV